VLGSRFIYFYIYWANSRREETLIKILIGNPEGKRQTGKTMCRWEANAKWILDEVRCERIDWNIMAQVTDEWSGFVNTVKKFWLSLKAGFLVF
jgi:hypothetical protein